MQIKLVLWIADKLGINPKAVLFLAAAILLFGIYQVKMYNSYTAGIEACKAANDKETIKVVETVRYVKQKVDSMPVGDVYDRLRDWTR